jgi:DNA-binding XRE family transcriptional regulator
MTHNAPSFSPPVGSVVAEFLSSGCTGLEQDFYTSDLMERLRNVRMQQGLSVEEVAAKVGVDPSIVSRWENSPMPDITLVQIAEYTLACGYSPLAMKLVNL